MSDNKNVHPENPPSIIRLGTRGSRLALIQANTVKDKIENIFPDVKVRIMPIKTDGDWKPSQGEVRLQANKGGKGQFTKEIEAALLNNKIDIAVHSSKDVETFMPDGLILAGMLPRDSVKDCLIIKNLADNIQKNDPFSSIPQGAKVGTASVRRQAFLLNRRPDLSVVPFRGNVGTRLEKLERGDVDVTLLAYAGLERLDWEGKASVVLEPEDFLPAAGQGAVTIQCRDKDENILSIISQIMCLQTTLCVKCERAALSVLDGSCHTPIGAYAAVVEKVGAGNEATFEIDLHLAVASLDGKIYETQTDQRIISSIEEAKRMGAEVAQKLKDRVLPCLFEQRIDT